MSGIMAAMLLGGGGPMSVTAYPPYLSMGTNSPPHFFTSPGSATGIVSGGVGPFTYAWTIISTNGFTFSANTPAALATTFNIGPFSSGDTPEATARLTVTDTGAGGATAFVDVDINLYVS